MRKTSYLEMPLRGPDVLYRRVALEAMGTHDRPTRLARLDELLPNGHVDAFLDFGVRNRVAPVLAHALLDARGTTFESSDRCQALHRESCARMAVMLDQLDLVAERLAAESISLVALKNGGIARGIYPCAGCCPMGDIDVLISRSRFRDAHALILECGFELAARSTVDPADLAGGELAGGTEYVRQVDGHEIWLELQWRPVAGRWIRSDQEPSGDELLERSVPIEGTAVRLLDPLDNMLQVCLHTAKHSFVRAPGLRLHTDVDRLAHFTPPPWSELNEVASRSSVRTAVFFSLALAEVLLDTPVPRECLNALAPSNWRAWAIEHWIWKADVFEPDDRKFTRPGMLGFHALLYDDMSGLVASVLDTEPEGLSLTRLPTYVGTGVRRLKDVATRYQR